MGNTVDVSITGTAAVDFIEGTVDANSVSVTGSGLFTRMRELAVTLTADSNPVPGATVNLLDASGSTAGTGATDASGQVGGLTFTTITVDNDGLITPSLVGYQVSTVAEVDYSYTSSSNNIMDFRYAFESATLFDTSGNSETVDLVDQITDRVCYGILYDAPHTIPVAHHVQDIVLDRRDPEPLETDGRRNGTDGTEYGYYGGIAGAIPRLTRSSWSTYRTCTSTVATDYNFNGSTLLATGGLCTSTDTSTLVSAKSSMVDQWFLHELTVAMYSVTQLMNPTTGSAT